MTSETNTIFVIDAHQFTLCLDVIFVLMICNKEKTEGCMNIIFVVAIVILDMLGLLTVRSKLDHLQNALYLVVILLHLIQLHTRFAMIEYLKNTFWIDN
jgi:hypothetical protein